MGFFLFQMLKGMCAQLRLALYDPEDCSPPGSSAHGILQAFPPPGDLLDPGIKPVFPEAPALAGGFFTTEPPEKSLQCEACSHFSNRPKGRRGPLAL